MKCLLTDFCECQLCMDSLKELCTDDAYCLCYQCYKRTRFCNLKKKSYTKKNNKLPSGYVDTWLTNGAEEWKIDLVNSTWGFND